MHMNASSSSSGTIYTASTASKSGSVSHGRKRSSHRLSVLEGNAGGSGGGGGGVMVILVLPVLLE